MSSHDGPKTIRKDTAAYASLSFFTCQRARLTKETKTNPARLPPKGASFRRLRPSVRKNRAVDEAYLANPRSDVNNNRKLFCKHPKMISMPHMYRQRNPARRNELISVLCCSKRHEVFSQCADCRQRSRMNASNDLRTFIAHGLGQTHRASPSEPAPGPSGLELHGLKAQHRSRARAQELMVTVSGKRRLPALAAAREGTHNRSPGECKGDFSRVHTASCSRAQSS